MKLLRDKHAEGLSFLDPSEEPCEICVKGKHRRDLFPRSSKRASAPLDLIHTELCGPMERKSIGGSSYFMTMIDDYSRKIKTVRSDNGREYVNMEFSKFLTDAGIRHQTTIPHSPQQNGRAERMNQTIVDKARCLLLDANLDKTFWAE
ncbi:retrovirus-related pol polyprotein, partial [Lasius niger]